MYDIFNQDSYLKKLVSSEFCAPKPMLAEMMECYIVNGAMISVMENRRDFGPHPIPLSKSTTNLGNRLNMGSAGLWRAWSLEFSDVSDSQQEISPVMTLDMILMTLCYGF